jgi:hypothetical protein
VLRAPSLFTISGPPPRKHHGSQWISIGTYRGQGRTSRMCSVPTVAPQLSTGSTQMQLSSALTGMHRMEAVAISSITLHSVVTFCSSLEQPTRGLPSMRTPFHILVITDLRRRQQVTFYGLGLNSSSILTSDLLIRAGIGSPVTPSDLTTTLNIYESLHNVVIGSLVICMAGLLPSCYAPFFLVDVWGRRPIQLPGFAMLTVLLAILGKMTTHQDSGVV